ncbi:hypothetical protein [Microcystis phage Mwe-JY08]
MSDLVRRLLAYRPTYGWPEERSAVITTTLNVEAAQRIASLERDLTEARDVMQAVLDDHLQDLTSASADRLAKFLAARGLPT